MQIKRVLIANRGEIAVRINRTLKLEGIESVVLYTTPEKDDLHVALGDLKISIGDGTLNETWLNIPLIIGIAKKYKVDAIHPGYGFLSENAKFAQACEEAGMIFIGPQSEVIEQMGSKTIAASVASKANVPLLPRIEGTPGEIIEKSRGFTFPVLVKAAAGGGGKGMIKVDSPDMLKHAVYTAADQAYRYFADDKVFVEKYVANPRHIEVQVIADQHGNAVHLFERECSLQRNHQKVVEEAPAIWLTHKVRTKIHEAALRLVRTTGYTNAGTVEFIVDQNQNFFFLEMNTRIQVEHPVTELITGVDLIREQLKIASGDKLSFAQEDIQVNGHAIEVRLYAEDPSENFRPSAGKIHKLLFPDTENLRIDTAIAESGIVHPNFDPMVSKIIVHENSRHQTIEKMRNTLERVFIHGIKSNLLLLKNIFSDKVYLENEVHTGLIKEKLSQWSASQSDELYSHLSAGLFIWITRYADKSGAWRHTGYESLQVNNKELNLFYHPSGENNFFIKSEKLSVMLKNIAVEQHEIKFDYNNTRSSVVYNYQTYDLMLLFKSGLYHIKKTDIEPVRKIAGKKASDLIPELKSNLFGRVLKILVKENQVVKNGDVLMILESMKMENSILAPSDSKVSRIQVKEGEQVSDGQILIHFK